MMPTRLNHYNLSTGYFRLYFDITTKSLSYVLAAALPDIELSWWCSWYVPRLSREGTQIGKAPVRGWA